MSKRISVLALGGTIASVKGKDGATPNLTAEDLVRSIPDLPEVDLRATTFRMLPSPSLKFDTVTDLVAEIRAEIAGGAHGIVVTQGTDTIEEVSFALDVLLSDLDVPVVVTGAMRHSGLAGPDGPANLLAAISLAMSDEARDLGVLVVLNDIIHAARFVRKMHTSSPNAFQSPSFGAIGAMSEGRVLLPLRMQRVAPLRNPQQVSVVKNSVFLATVVFDDHGFWMNAARSNEVDGVVLAGLGGGHIPEWLADEVVELAAIKPVVLCSRTGAGAGLTKTYNIKGGEMDLLSRGLIHSGILDPLKSRVLLSCLISEGAGEKVIRAAFDSYLH